MKPWIMLLVIVALFAGLNAFGSVNQFEIETGLTVDASMLPTERTVEMLENPVNITAYAEFAIANTYDTTDHVELIAPSYLIGAPIVEVTPAINRIRLEDRLKYPVEMA